MVLCEDGRILVRTFDQRDASASTGHHHDDRMLIMPRAGSGSTSTPSSNHALLTFDPDCLDIRQHLFVYCRHVEPFTIGLLWWFGYAVPDGFHGWSFAETNVVPVHSLDHAAVALLLPYAIIGLMAHAYGYGDQTQMLITSSRLGCREAVFNVVLNCRATIQSSIRTSCPIGPSLRLFGQPSGLISTRRHRN
jgi:hypothetical protein